MKTYHQNSEGWYQRDWSILHHIRNWFIWVGGWEEANGKGWRLFRNYGRGWRIADPTPISMLGHRFTFFGFRQGWYIRLRRGYFVWSRSGGELHIYISPDCTAARATTWIYNAPHEIVSQSHKP